MVTKISAFTCVVSMEKISDDHIIMRLFSENGSMTEFFGERQKVVKDLTEALCSRDCGDWDLQKLATVLISLRRTLRGIA